MTTNKINMRKFLSDPLEYMTWVFYIIAIVLTFMILFIFKMKYMIFILIFEFVLMSIHIVLAVIIKYIMSIDHKKRHAALKGIDVETIEILNVISGFNEDIKKIVKKNSTLGSQGFYNKVNGWVQNIELASSQMNSVITDSSFLLLVDLTKGYQVKIDEINDKIQSDTNLTDKQKNEFEKQIKNMEETSQHVSDVHAEYDTLKMKIKTLESMMQKVFASLVFNQSRRATIDYDKLMKEVDTESEIMDDYLEAFHEVISEKTERFN